MKVNIFHSWSMRCIILHSDHTDSISMTDIIIDPFSRLLLCTWCIILLRDLNPLNLKRNKNKQNKQVSDIQVCLQVYKTKLFSSNIFEEKEKKGKNKNKIILYIFELEGTVK